MSRKRRAFTLIELLLVVAIIAVLTAILLPALAAARAQSRRAVCEANLHGLGAAFRQYLDEYHDIMPIATRLPSAHLDADPRICDVLMKYVNEPLVFKCPADIVREYFLTEGSSYEYNTSLGGRRLIDTFLNKRFGDTETHVMYDYEPFHGEPGVPGSTIYLYADWHVGFIQ